jgi:hypothetical protein
MTVLTCKCSNASLFTIAPKKNKTSITLSLQVNKWTFAHSDTIKTSWTFYKLEIFVHMYQTL